MSTGCAGRQEPSTTCQGPPTTTYSPPCAATVGGTAATYAAIAASSWTSRMSNRQYAATGAPLVGGARCTLPWRWSGTRRPNGNSDPLWQPRDPLVDAGPRRGGGPGGR